MTNWFDLGDGQPFERTLDDQLKGLEYLADRIKGKNVFEYGCAEGLIGKWCLDRGAATYTGYEKLKSRVAVAASLGLTVYCVDLDSFVPDPATYVQITLALAIVHKLAKPEEFLRRIARHTSELIVLRLPGPVIVDRRSGFRAIDPVMTLSKDWAPVHYTRGDRNEWMVYLERRDAR